MDAMNRTLGLQLLIEMSLDNPSRQLILLSPQVRQHSEELRIWILSSGDRDTALLHCP